MRRNLRIRVEGRSVSPRQSASGTSKTLRPIAVWVEAPARIYWIGAILGVLCAAAALLALGTML